MAEDIKWPLMMVNDDGIRPAGPADACLYCNQKVGQPHDRECVTIHKIMRLRYVIEIDVEVPHYWDKERVEFHRNDGTWCANNTIDDISKAAVELANAGSCLCPHTRIEFVADMDVTPRQHLQTEHQMAIGAAVRLAQVPVTGGMN